MKSLCDKCVNVCKATSPRKECELFSATERDRLIKEITEKFHDYSPAVVDTILADRRRVLDEIEKPLKDVLEELPRAYQGYVDAIDESLLMIERLRQ